MTAVLDALQLRTLTDADFDALHAGGTTNFHGEFHADERDVELAVFEPDRTIGVFDDGRIVGAAGAYTRTLTVPGGPLPVACVTWVSVAAAYTRRGLLNRMMRHQLHELHEQRGEPVAALWASESGIYGRYGYGIGARHGRFSVNTREVRLNRGLAPKERRVRVGPATDQDLRVEIAAVYERFRDTAVGHLDRRGKWWDRRLFDPEYRRDGSAPLRIAVHDGPAGPDGYALYSVAPNWTDRGPTGTASVRELCAETAEAEAALWSFLLGLDLVSELGGHIVAGDFALPHLVDHPRRIGVSLVDNLWVRLVDVDRALAARRYAAAVDVVFDVTDPFCPWNAGRWRLSGGPDGARCVRTEDTPDLTLTSTELGAAYLGGTSLSELAQAGRVTELRPGALRAAAIAFAEPTAPFCPEVF